MSQRVNDRHPGQPMNEKSWHILTCRVEKDDDNQVSIAPFCRLSLKLFSL
jgi:hypothetical protein